jgi:hypothetical protein
MITINIVLGCIMVIIIGIGLFWMFVNYQQYKKNSRTAEELDTILRSTLEIVKGARVSAAKQKDISISDLAAENELGGPNDLTSPMMLSTIVTVLVRKFGDMRLSMKDFMIPNEEYVSVYVDTESRELILSLNHKMDPADPYSMVSFSDPDDNTFH